MSMLNRPRQAPGPAPTPTRTFIRSQWVDWMDLPPDLHVESAWTCEPTKPEFRVLIAWATSGEQRFRRLEFRYDGSHVYSRMLSE